MDLDLDPSLDELDLDIREVVRELDLDADPERVWDALTDDSLLGDWLADDVRIDPVEGGVVYADCDDGERHGTVVRVDSGRELAFTWSRDGDQASFVSFSIERRLGGTRIRVREVAPARSPLALAWGPRLLALAAVPRLAGALAS